MSKEILFYSDIHYRESGSFFPYNIIDSNGLTKELNNTNLGMKFIANQIKLHKPRMVVCLGDLFHSPEVITIKTLYAMCVGLSFVKAACEAVGAKHYVILGNHDILSEKSSISGMFAIKGFFEEVIYEADYKTELDKKLLFLPYSSNLGEVYKTLLDARENADYIFTHLDFAGCRYNSGISSHSNISPDIGVPCISGDIHLPQKVGTVQYVGSLVQNQFGFTDLENVGGCLVLNLETGKTKLIQNNLSKHYVTFYDDGDLSKLPPAERVVLKLVTKRTKEECEEVFSGYEYQYTKWLENKTNELKPYYTNRVQINSKLVLRSYLKDNNPTALDIFDEVLNESEKTIEGVNEN